MKVIPTDPIEGGSANDYDYAAQDPINHFDLDGNCWQAWQKRCRGRHSWVHLVHGSGKIVDGFVQSVGNVAFTGARCAGGIYEGTGEGCEAFTDPGKAGTVSDGWDKMKEGGRWVRNWSHGLKKPWNQFWSPWRRLSVPQCRYGYMRCS